jgi:hypothetical protein
MRNNSYVPVQSRRGAWWRSKPVVALASALVGLIAGLSLTDGGNSGALSKKVDSLAAQRSDLKSQVLQLKDSAIDQSEVDQQVADAVDQARTDAAAAQKEAVAAAVAKERARAARLVAAAKKSAASKSSSSSSSSSSSGGSSGGGGTDPRFSTCAAANAAGYGPYRSGVDPEYDWYQDRDGDGVDCEP